MAIRRRNFLKTLGAASLVLPGMDLLGSRALGQTGAPKRFIAVMGALGIATRRWVLGTPDSYELGPGLQPLARHRDDLTIFRGLQAKRANHDPGTACFLTGDDLENGAAKHATIDQVIASANEPSAAAASGRIVRSIQCGVGVRDTGGRSTMVYETRGSPLHPRNNPAELFDEMFGDGSMVADGGSSDTATRAAAERSILDAHTAELAALSARAGSGDRQRLEAHLDGLRTLERDLERLRDGDVAIGMCSAPGRYEPEGTIGAAPYDRIAEAHCDIIGRAFACDTTRVATLQLFYDPGSGIGLDFLEGRQSGISANSVHDTKHAAGAASDTIDDWYAEVVAYLLDQLSQEDPFDPEGGRIIDNTVLLFGSNLHAPFHGAGPNYGRYGGDGEQDTTDPPYLIAGSGGGFFHTGRYFDHRVEGLFYGENPSKYSPGDGHVYHNRLLVSILNAFGHDVSSYGDTAYSEGGALDGGLIR